MLCGNFFATIFSKLIREEKAAKKLAREEIAAEKLPRRNDPKPASRDSKELLGFASTVVGKLV